jgi:putative GTP pyrophosphokinase
VASEPLSKTQLDKLGDRLRAGSREEADIRALDDYRRSFRGAYESVFAKVEQLGVIPTGRPAKTTTAIVDKLIRQNIRLTQIQDIAGLRVVVPDVSEQNRLINELRFTFRDVAVFDRREKSSHGYRAVHVVAGARAKGIEIQVRTRAQHLWAEISEKLADTVDYAIKYGGGPLEIRDTLEVYSIAIKSIEDSEAELIKARENHAAHEREASVIPATDPQHLQHAGWLDRHRLLLIDKESTVKRLKSELLVLLEDAYNEIGPDQ